MRKCVWGKVGKVDWDLEWRQCYEYTVSISWGHKKTISQLPLGLDWGHVTVLTNGLSGGHFWAEAVKSTWASSTSLFSCCGDHEGHIPRWQSHRSSTLDL